MIVISDTTPILSLLKAGRLDLLQKLYESVIIPESVYNELTINPLFIDEKEKITECPFLRVEKAKNLKSVRILRDVTGLDAGESEALIIYDEKQADLLLIDEHKGRSVAKKMSVEYIGTLGIFMLAYDKKILSAEEIEQCLNILLNKNIRLSRRLCNKVLCYIGSDKTV